MACMSDHPAKASTGLYLHIPFCQAKCNYCDFVSYAGLEHLHADYVRALIDEITLCADAWADARFETVFIGGGTPTVLPPSQLALLLAACRRSLRISEDAEVTIEANPGTVDYNDLVALRAAGINRISLGVQSLDDKELALLGRIHDAQEAINAYRLARRAGFDNINLDLIFGLPNQTVKRWRETLKGALALRPDHLSLYALTVEENTPLALSIAQGVLPEPDDDLAADMYELAEEMLESAGYRHYEISNWARRTSADTPTGFPSLACRHNLIYWHNGRYLGLGVAAHSYDGEQRIANLSDPVAYIAHMQAGELAIATSESLSLERRMGEMMMLGLRLIQGVSWRCFEERFGVSLQQVYAHEIDDLAEKGPVPGTDGLLIVDEQGIRLSKRGRLLGNRVFAAFVR